MAIANTRFNGVAPPNPMDRFSAEQKIEMMQEAVALRKKHPTWKPERLMRKVAEKYKVKLDMSDGLQLKDVLKNIVNEQSSGRSVPVGRDTGDTDYQPDSKRFA